jgi:aminomethyltransferase
MDEKSRIPMQDWEIERQAAKLIGENTMNDAIKKSVLCDFVSRHSDFDFDTHMTATPPSGYDIWNGYCLPMHYTNADDEYAAIRERCGMFDISPMKKYRFRGRDAGAFLDRLLTAPVSHLANMKAAYGLLCNEAGLLLDDGIVTKFSDDNYLLFVSEIDLDAHFARYNDFADLTIFEETHLLAGLALQGPKSCTVLNHFAFTDIEHLKPFELKYFELDGFQILVGRLGFTGDLGYELWFEPAATDAVASAFAKAETKLGFDVTGYALSALQICRIEAGMIVPGWDTAGLFRNPEQERTPFELTLGWNVKLDRDTQFAGKNSLIKWKAEGTRFKMKGVRIDAPGPLSEGQDLFATIDGRAVRIGSLPSIVWHTRDDVWIGFASVAAAHADIQSPFVVVDAKPVACQFCKLPFIKLEHASQLPAEC